MNPLEPFKGVCYKKARKQANIEDIGFSLVLATFILLVATAFLSRYYLIAAVICFVAAMVTGIETDFRNSEYYGEVLSRYGKLKKLFNNPSIPDYIKLIINLNFIFNGASESWEAYYDWQKNSIYMLTHIKEYPESLPFIDKEISDNNIDVNKLIPLALNIASTPSLFSEHGAYESVESKLYWANDAIKKGFSKFRDYYNKIRKADALQKINALSKQDFSSITEIKNVGHVDSRPLL